MASPEHVNKATELVGGSINQSQLPNATGTAGALVRIRLTGGRGRPRSHRAFRASDSAPALRQRRSASTGTADALVRIRPKSSRGRSHRMLQASDSAPALRQRRSASTGTAGALVRIRPKSGRGRPRSHRSLKYPPLYHGSTSSFGTSTTMTCANADSLFHLRGLRDCALPRG